MPKDYIAAMRPRFYKADFVVKRDVEFQQQRFRMMAVKKIKATMLVCQEDFYFFTECDTVSIQSLTGLCAIAWNCALTRRGPLPQASGFFRSILSAFSSHQLGYDVNANRTPHEVAGIMLNTYCVAVVSKAPPDVIEWVTETKPNILFNQGIRTPLLYESRSNRLHYFAKVPWFGNDLYRASKKKIAKYLVPSTSSDNEDEE